MAEGWNHDGQFPLAVCVRQHLLRTLVQIGLQYLALDGATDEPHGYLAPLFVDEPLGQVVFKRDIQADVRQGLVRFYMQSY